jgi:hypothetical protein
MSNIEQESEPYKYPIPAERVFESDNNFRYHIPQGDQPRRYERLRSSARFLADEILGLTPKSREQSLALTNLEQALFWANAAIARNEK